MDAKKMDIKKVAQRTYEIIQMHKKKKEYDKRALDCDIRFISIRGYERTARRKIGQFTRRR